MLRSILIDDEQAALDTLGTKLNRHCPEVRIEASCLSAKEGMKAINRYRPDVVFLDIQMPHMNGFEMLECLGEIDFHVVFVTAFNEFAVQAFRYSAVDYLMKPVRNEHLKEAVGKAIEHKEKALPQERFEVLLSHFRNPNDPFKKIGFYANEGVEFVRLNDIIYCKADGNYTNVFLSTRKRLFASESLKEIHEQKLKDPPFCRIHNSHLINVNHANQYVKGDGGYVVMENGEKLSVARSRKEQLLKMISG